MYTELCCLLFVSWAVLKLALQVFVGHRSNLFFTGKPKPIHGSSLLQIETLDNLQGYIIF